MPAAAAPGGSRELVRQGWPGLGSVLVVVPTYCERDSLPSVVARLRRAVPGADVLVVDDGSPDGTGACADELAASDDQVGVLHRPAKHGLGRAYVAGFRVGLAAGADVLVEIDADGSHAPEALPVLLEALARPAPDGTRTDAVIGSRWVVGGEVVAWPAWRRALSRGGNAYVRLLLGLGVADATAGFRAYRADLLAALDLSAVSSRGYAFQVDLTRRAVAAGARVVEVPVTFVERTTGRSKMSTDVVAEALVRVTAWGVAHRGAQAVGALRRARGR